MFLKYFSSTAAIAGDDFVVSVSDTRMTQFEVNILTRNTEKIHILNDKIILNTSGFYGDVLQLKRVLSARIHKFRFDYREDLSVDLCSELLARTLYSKRFFPYYTGAVLLGIDEFGLNFYFYFMNCFYKLFRQRCSI